MVLYVKSSVDLRFSMSDGNATGSSSASCGFEYHTVPLSFCVTENCVVSASSTNFTESFSSTSSPPFPSYLLTGITSAVSSSSGIRDTVSATIPIARRNNTGTRRLFACSFNAAFTFMFFFPPYPLHPKHDFFGN